MATNTYVALDKITTTGSVSSVTFSSINQGYTDLVIVANIQQVTNGEDVAIQFNGDTTSLYSRTYLCGDGSTAHSGRSSSATSIICDHHATPPTADSFSTNIIQVQNYSNTTTNKSVLARAGSLSSVAGTAAVVGLWRSTAAITSATIFCTNGSNIKTGSTFSLYGIRAEGVSPAAKATGGAIYSDDTYYYHVFGSTGTFTPLSSLTADVLVVAGGGGGGAGTNGSNGGGGGGAGGLLAFTSQSLTATGYTCTVGAGGTGNGSTGVSTNGGDSQFGALTLVKGGGAGGSNYGSSASWPGSTGGSGGGGYGRSAVGGSATSGQGYAGGTGGADSGNYAGAGGGGAGAVGANGNSGGNAGAGGIGINTYSSWSTATGTGVSGYFAGGGAGGSYSSTAAVGGSGGGGNGGASNAVATAGVANTGGGGGASGGNSTGAGTGKNGGSGIVIVRYLKA
jgi:hypothetical protein